AGDIQELVILDVISELTADATVRTHAMNLAVRKFRAHILVVNQRRGHQRAGRTGLHTFAAGDARGLAHRIVEVENNLFAMTAAGHANHVVDLHFTAGADAQVTLDAGIQIDRHGRVTTVGRWHPFALGKASDIDAHSVGPAPELGLRIARGCA